MRGPKAARYRKEERRAFARGSRRETTSDQSRETESVAAGPVDEGN